MKLFIPAVSYRIRLAQDWHFSLYHEDRNDTLLRRVSEEAAVGGSYSDHYVDGDYHKGLKHTAATLPMGTLLEVDRVYVRTANKAKSGALDYDSVTFKVIGGGKVRFWTKLADVNNIEYELPEDFTAGKSLAQEKARAPKKLTPKKIMELVDHGIRQEKHSHGRTAPDWLTKDLVKQFKRLENEHNRLMDPYNLARHEAQAKKWRAELEHGIATGTLSLPMAQAGLIKTVEDLIAVYPHYGDRLRLTRTNHESWEYIVTYQVMSTYAGTVKFVRLADSRCLRTFRPAKRPLTGWNADAPDLSHLWVNVYTDALDHEIVQVEAGFDVKEEAK